MKMFYVIVPCKDESATIKKVITEADKSCADRILVIENGSTDNSLDIINSIDSEKLDVLSFNISMGHDVPRAAGLLYSLSEGGTGFVFIDGDMSGVTSKDINSIIHYLKKGSDLVLTDCYPDNLKLSRLALGVLFYRKKLNTILGIYDKIKYASPSHGPHGISKRFGGSIPPEFLCIPPYLLYYAVKNNYSISIGLKKAHIKLGSQERSEQHNLKISDTIIGDCVSVINLLSSGSRARVFKNISYDGFNSERRLDILDIVKKETALKQSWP
jgi:glycosyltransferase involved in cell wall biosynthesis